MVSSISYVNLSQKIIDCELPSSETLNILSTGQQIEILKLCYNGQKKLLNQLLEEKKLENADIEIPIIQLPKRNKTQITQNLNNDELELSIQQNIKKITNANKENMSIDFEKEFCEKDEDCSSSSFSTYTTPTLNNYVTLDSNEYIDPTPSGHITSTLNSDCEEADEDYMTQTSKTDTNSKKHNQSLESPLPKRIRKEDTQLPLQSTSNNRLQEIQNAKISNKA
ncbi:18848_t:CDS:2, partial [Racocetra fulgida]